MADTKSKNTCVPIDRAVFNETDNYLMGIAFLAAKQSKDPNCKVGACIVDENREVVSVGYNGMPEGCSGFCWERTKDVNDKLLYVCHAEFNAIVNGRTANFKGCTLYVTRLPNNESAKLVIRSGIKRVIYLSDRKGWKKRNVSAKKLFSEAQVVCEKLPTPEPINISFGEDLYDNDDE